MTMDRQQLMVHRSIEGGDKRRRFGGLALMLTMLLTATLVQAADLQDVDFTTLPGDKAQVTLTFSEAVAAPENFATDEPARIVLDFNGVKNKLSERTQEINSGETRSIATVEAGDRTRMVINLLRKIPYDIATSGNTVKITLNGNAPQMSTSKARGSAVAMTGNQVTDIDFRRGEDGEARVIIDMSTAGAAVDVRQERDTVVVEIPGVSLPDKLHRRLDVVDFATPVSIIDSEQGRDGTTLTLTTNRDFEHLAYQSDNQMVVEVKARETRSQQARDGEQTGYSGEKLSLNFQNIEVRAVLQLLADFNGMNLVTSDTVTGNLTLRLKNVPWDQALDIILKTKGLAMRQNGNVMLIAPAAEIAAREKQELEAKKQLIELEPLYSEIIEINFAKAGEIAAILTTTQGDSADGKGGFLSERGSVVVDNRTNSLLLRDTADQLVAVQKLIEQLDIPVRQVLIESRIVVANNDFGKELGVRFGASARSRTLGAGTSGSLEGLEVREGNSNPNLASPVALGTDPRGLGQDLNVNLPVANPAGSVALALAKLPLGMILELELSAMQEEGRGEVISSPRVITSNQKQATISQGTEIPFQEASSSGATAVSFKEALLELDVTPQITPDDRIVMDLEVSQDTPGEIFLGVPSIDTRNVQTQVLVDNGETVVLGGIYEQTKNYGSQRVPFFGDLPYVGALFRNTFSEDRQRELLIFVTPKIVKEGMQY